MKYICTSTNWYRKAGAKKEVQCSNLFLFIGSHSYKVVTRSQSVAAWPCVVFPALNSNIELSLGVLWRYFLILVLVDIHDSPFFIRDSVKLLRPWLRVANYRLWASQYLPFVIVQMASAFYNWNYAFVVVLPWKTVAHFSGLLSPIAPVRRD